jgi:hypothetical protein
MGRPSDYSDEIADLICERLANGEALYRMCRDEGLPDERTVYRWLAAHDQFRQKYAHARERQADLRAEEIVTIADEAKDANLARLQIDARKWQASKLAPKKYGDKIAVGGDADAPPIVHRIERHIVHTNNPDSSSL